MQSTNCFSNEREIAHWQTFATEQQKIAMELAMCIETVGRISTTWLHADAEDRRGLARSLFEYIVYDLDKRRIVDFRLKSWAERFIILRAKLYGQDDHEGVQNNTETESEEKEGNYPNHGEATYAPYGVRTRVFALRGRCPRPLDEWSLGDEV